MRKPHPRRITILLCRAVDSIPIEPTPRQTPHNRRITGVTHVYWHRFDGLVKHLRRISQKVESNLEFLRIAVQQLVEEVRTGIHQLPNPGRPNQHTRIRRKVGLTVTDGPFVYNAKDDLPHALRLTVHMAATSGSILPPRVRPCLVRGEHHQPDRCCIGLLHTVILFESVANCLVRP
ncbi:hypothetical protein TCDM_12436 [Trypanosoma cruzi Dm28c]|uniref:Uncharacterized protein n=1 Tax=Trypanosoma cruzi Dm28c TaxID=1416333 RepID=V5APJ4_TRYCR|nr:hypothetical protein TCDM_12436 [Trypanosoma cruzi Dm28c]